MGDRISFAVISDLHCTYDNNYGSQDTILFSNTVRNGDRKNQIQELLDLFDAENIKCDYVLCPGDITNKMDVQGLISGFGYLREIQAALGAQQLICAPGNHDVDFCRNNTSLFAKASDSLKQLDSMHYPLSDKDLSRSLIDDGYCLYRNDKVAILCINSVASFTDKSSSEKVFISESTLRSIENQLKTIPTTTTIRIALTHHHPILYTDLNFRSYNTRDYIENGDTLIELIEKYHFNLLIHGHKHRAKLTSSRAVTLFGAGGFSALQNLQTGDNENTFHIVEVDSESPTKGIIRTWSYSCSAGWKKPSLQFPYKTGFGSTKNAIDLAEEIGTHIQEKYGDQQACIPFSYVVDRFKEIEYIHHERLKELYNELKKYSCEHAKGDEQEYLLYQPKQKGSTIND